MKLLTFETDAGPAVGAIAADGESVVDLTAAGVAPDMNELIDRGAEGLASAREAVAAAGSEVRPLSACRVLAPIIRPRRNIMCVGKNYYEHANEFHNSGFDAAAGKTAVPEFPIFFTKATTSVIAAGDPIPASSDPTQSVDYEGELAVIIGLGGRGIPRNRAFDHVFGYANLNDVTARALQRRHNQWFLGKSLDGFCPFGPYIVTADAAGEVGEMHLRTTVNGEVRQQASVGDLIFDIPTLIETLSATMTLEPGDIIATGTPVGVGLGFDPPKFLARGDRVVVEISGLGRLENPVA